MELFKIKRIFIYFIGIVVFLSCGSDAEKVPEEKSVGVNVVVKSATELGPINATENVLARDGGISAKIGNSMFWLFADTLF